VRALAELREVGLGRVLSASVTPLASIFGSGFLIIVPVLERALGALAVLGAIGVSAVAWMVGSAIRHNIQVVEPLAARGRLGTANERLERISDAVIAVAYVVSVALYLRIMAEYVVDHFADGEDTATSTVAAAAVAIIVLVGVTRGFSGLHLMERLALGAVLVLTTVLGAAYFFESAGQVVGDGVEFPPVPEVGIGHTMLVLGGIVITVQGFETVRYLGDEYDAATRIWASRAAQAIAASIYVGFIVVATPLMGLGTAAGADSTLLDITERVAPLLALPLVVCATLSQFSAATADTVAARENLRAEFPRLLGGGRAYALSGIAAVAMIWTIPTLTIVTVASRAFAAYYCLQCVLAFRTAGTLRARIGFALLGAAMAMIALLAQPVG
jgi:hypothetical protein